VQQKRCLWQSLPLENRRATPRDLGMRSNLFSCW
jgi:hypothetical protein